MTQKSKVSKSNGKSLDKKKVLPTKKFPELKLMINGEYRNGNNTLSSDDDMSLAVSAQASLLKDVTPYATRLFDSNGYVCDCSSLRSRRSSSN